MRRRVAALCQRFPAETAVFSRPVLDEFNQISKQTTPLGSLECWRIPGARPEMWSVGQPGQVYEDDGSIWVTLIWRADMPALKHGDICMLPDGVPRYVRNIQNRANIRVLLQLSEV